MFATEVNSISITDLTHIDELPTVTVAIPVYNEEKHIRRVVEGFLATGYPNLVEILIADGRSTDKTREIVSELTKQDSRVKLVDNPEKYQSYGLNRMIDVAEGEVFLRADGHCHYKEDYIEKCVSVMLKTGARNVGGAQRYMAKNRVQAGIALAVKSVLGNGGAKYMDENYLGYADTVFLGCFRTKDLREIGGFNTENVTNEDSELNLRFIKKFGDSSIYISPEIGVWYYPRDSYFKLFKQYFNYGRGRFLTRSLHPKIVPFRSILPFLGISMIILYSIIDFAITPKLYSAQVIGFFIAIILVESFRVVIFKKNTIMKDSSFQKFEASIVSKLLNTLLSLTFMLSAYFFGFLYQMIRKVSGLAKPW